jgi:hypothetical protein
MRELINNAIDWKWYCAKIDVEQRCHYKHGEGPTQYPVKVASETWGDDRGDYISHVFTYRQRVECDHCHAVTIVWPEEPR